MAKRTRRHVDPEKSFDPNRIYTKRGLLKAVELGEESLADAIKSGAVKPAHKAGKNWYRGSEIAAASCELLRMV